MIYDKYDIDKYNIYDKYVKVNIRTKTKDF